MTTINRAPRITKNYSDKQAVQSDDGQMGIDRSASILENTKSLAWGLLGVPGYILISPLSFISETYMRPAPVSNSQALKNMAAEYVEVLEGIPKDLADIAIHTERGITEFLKSKLAD